MNTTVDLTPVVSQIVLPIAQVIIAGVAAACLAWLLRKFKIDQNSALGQQLQQAASGGAGLAYQMLAKQGARLGDVDLHNVALAAGTNYVLAQVPAAIKAAGITPATVQTMVQAEFGKLLGASPTEGLAAPVAPPAAPAIAPAAASPPVPVAAVGDPAPSAFDHPV